MKKKIMTEQPTPTKEILIQFKVPEDVAFQLRIMAAQEKFATLSKYMQYLAVGHAGKQ